MEISRRGLLRKGGGLAAATIGVNATVTDQELDFDVMNMSGTYSAKGEMQAVYKGEDALDVEEGRYDIGLDDNLLSADVAGSYAAVDVDMDGSWELQVGVNYQGEGCTASDREEFKETAEAYGVAVENGTLDVKDNKSAREHGDDIADMLEEGAENGSAC